ncbi:MAG TPA: cytochrome c [Sphingomicrobium sp.]|nr:cytochrome c [Sphingomicrobium sp.]
MVRTACVALGAIVLLSCSASKSNQANAASNSVAASAEARTPPKLTHDQALALMKQRNDNMKAMGDAAGKVGKSFQSGSPDLNVIRQAAAQIASLAPKVVSWFPAGTGPDVGKTRAKAEIWQKPEDFASKAHDLSQAATDFNDAAKLGDVNRIKVTFGAMGKTCKACHDLYRAPEH